MDTIIVAVIVGAAVIYSIKNLVKIYKGDGGCGCPGGCACSSDNCCSRDIIHPQKNNTR